MRFLDLAAVESLGNNPGLAIIRFCFAWFQFLSGAARLPHFFGFSLPDVGIGRMNSSQLPAIKANLTHVFAVILTIFQDDPSMLGG